MGADIENEINKIRWERWRAKQKAEREKTYFYCWGQWNQWNNWSDVPPEKCGCDECPKVVAVKGADDDFNYMMYHIYRARGHSN